MADQPIHKIHVEGVGEVRRRPSTRRALVFQAVALMTLWLILSGKFDLLHMGMGAASVALVMWFNYRIQSVQLGSETMLDWGRVNYGRLLLYIPWLFIEIIKASLDVAYAVLHPRMPIDPELIRFRTKLPTAGAQVILGNSLSVMPGTVTIEINGDEFLIHSLMPKSYATLADGSVPNRVVRLFREGDETTTVEEFRRVTK